MNALKRLFIQSCLALLCASALVSAYEPPASRRAKYNFNSGWKLFVGDPKGAETPGFDDSGWKDVTTPHAWNEDDAFRKDIKDLSTGVSWYRKHFKLPAGADGRKVFLEFEGIRQAGEFYLNGRHVGRHENGITAFGFDVTDALRPAPNYVLSKSLPVENGVNRVVIRSTTRAGRVVLTAAAEGLKPASVELASRPFAVAAGLSSAMPDGGLASYLERGPTPAGPSFKVSRSAVRIARVSAGARADRAAATFDDDETTEWASDGKIENGWIAYEFDRPARVSEVVLKLRGWRTQSYPLRVLLDDRVVFAGVTPRSLGYVTLAFPPVVGRTLKIELTGSASNRDAFGNIIEIPGTPDPQSAAGKGGARGTLGIIEVEVYEPVGGGVTR